MKTLVVGQTVKRGSTKFMVESINDNEVATLINPLNGGKIVVKV